jgi:hypothetical protein
MPQTVSTTSVSASALRSLQCLLMKNQRLALQQPPPQQLLLLLLPWLAAIMPALT